MNIQKIGNLIPLVNGNAIKENCHTGTTTLEQDLTTFEIRNLGFSLNLWQLEKMHPLTQ